MNCTWCGTEGENLTDDHVIPRSIGGTLDYTVIACPACQNKLSKAEEEVSRKSILAIPALASPLSARHPKRPSSGLLRPRYLLVPHPDGGYGESAMRSGESLESLPHFEAKVVVGEALEGRIRGPSPAAAQRLLDTFRLALKNKPGPDGCVCSITTDLGLDPSISADPDFWPRIVLLPGDRLVLRGRDPDELMRFLNVFMQLVLGDYKVDADRWGSGSVIKGGTTHSISLDYDPQTLRRIAAKIAYGLFIHFSSHSLDEAQDVLLRQYVLGLSESESEPVSVSPWPEPMVTSDSPHYVVLSPANDQEAAIVCIYGFAFRVELGVAARSLPAPAVVICQIDGSCMRVATADEAEKFLSEARRKTFSQPWVSKESSSISALPSSSS